MANLEDGTYSAIGRVVEAAYASKGGLSDLIAFTSVAEAVQSGILSVEAATKQVDQISSAYAKLWTWINTNGAGLSLLLSILTICITYYAILEANAGSDQSHVDALAQRQATETQTQVARNNLQAQSRLQQVQEQIYELLAQHQQGVRPLAQPASPILSKPAAVALRTQAAPKSQLNRHGRRKAAKVTKPRN